MRRRLLWIAFAGLLAQEPLDLVPTLDAGACQEEIPQPQVACENSPAPRRQRLVIAFSSLRDRPAFANLYFYRHDGIGRGELNEAVPAQFERADTHPSLASDSARCAYASKQVGGFTPLVNLWNRSENRPLPAPAFNSQEGSRIEPALSGDGRFLAFVSDRPGGAGGKDVYLFDLEKRRLVDLPGLNSVAHEQTPALSPDGRYVAFVSERSAGAGERDIYLYDRELSQLIPTPGLNSPQEDFDPALAYESTD